MRVDILRVLIASAFVIATSSSSFGQPVNQPKESPNVRPGAETPSLSVEEALKVGRARACSAYLEKVCDPATDRHCLSGIAPDNLPDVCKNLDK